MMRSLLALFVGVAALTLTGLAADKPAPKALVGNMVCAKCTLAETDQCQNALVVKADGKEVVYYLDDKKANHKKVCSSGSELKVKVTGKIVEKDGKKWIMNAKVTEVK